MKKEPDFSDTINVATTMMIEHNILDKFEDSYSDLLIKSGTFFDPEFEAIVKIAFFKQFISGYVVANHNLAHELNAYYDEREKDLSSDECNVIGDVNGMIKRALDILDK